MRYLIVACFLFSTCTGESLYRTIPEFVSDHVRIRRQHGQQQIPYQQAPAQIKQLLALQQAREPLVHIPVHNPPHLQNLGGGQQQQQQQQQQHQAAAPQPQLTQPQQYTPKVQYGQAPQQPTYQGIQPNQRAPQQIAPQNYSPQYKTQYNQAPQQLGPNNIYRPQTAGPPGGGQYAPRPQQPQQGQYPSRLPPHLQQVIDQQRAYQG